MQVFAKFMPRLASTGIAMRNRFAFIWAYLLLLWRGGDLVVVTEASAYCSMLRVASAGIAKRNQFDFQAHDLFCFLFSVVLLRCVVHSVLVSDVRM